MYFDDAKNKCVPCGYGFYQPNEGAFICISCGLDLTTKSDTAVSFQECKGKNLCYNGRLSNLSYNLIIIEYVLGYNDIYRHIFSYLQI